MAQVLTLPFGPRDGDAKEHRLSACSAQQDFLRRFSTADGLQSLARQTFLATKSSWLKRADVSNSMKLGKDSASRRLKERQSYPLPRRSCSGLITKCYRDAHRPLPLFKLILAEPRIGSLRQG